MFDCPLFYPKWPINTTDSKSYPDRILRKLSLCNWYPLQPISPWSASNRPTFTHYCNLSEPMHFFDPCDQNIKCVPTKAINEEVEQLLQADILEEVFYPTWLSNPVMVRKPDFSWRMCVDYTDLNKACPKDCHPLPVIEQKVDALVGFRIKSFLDAYKGYHQIFMADDDAEKNRFYHWTWSLLLQKKFPLVLRMLGRLIKEPWITYSTIW